MAHFKFAFIVFIALDSSALAGVIDAQSARDEWSAMQDTCKDCTQIMELFADMLKNADTQDLIKKALEDLCKLLPGTKAQNLCVEQVEKNLPMAIKLMTAFIKPSQICTSIGLCKGQSQGMEEELLTNLIANFNIAPGTGTMSEMPSSVQCTLCMLLLKNVETVISTAQGTVVKILAAGCVALPSVLRRACRCFVERVVLQLVEFLLSWATPQRVCSLLRLCSSQDDCYSCQTLAVLAQFHLGSNATELQTSSFLESVCMLHPSAIPECESFTQHHRLALQRALAKPVGILDLCEGALLCAAETETGVEGRDPCSRGALYRCRDQTTAKECNSVSFCEKYVWQ
ncbi:hypothetical protein AGOR_G00010960 [Albula goreensis]|uniref:Uncharacterized protein n=1 Tax=Albula goreensis TaxID=1534307 RepID=A0A8T3E682_9TELE|nr:hypothetical protein AGOR_G00010960 [Albula goreensis]